MIVRSLMMMFSLIAFITACSNSDKETSQVRQLINKTFDTPNDKVVVEPVVVADGHAIADWSQGDKAGRALVKMKNGEWRLWLCGGKGLREAEALIKMGVPEPTAKKLSSEISIAEKKLSKEQVDRFDNFGPPVDFSGEMHSLQH